MDDIRPTTLIGVKRYANQIKKSRDVPHTAALEFAAKAAGCANFKHARSVLPKGGLIRTGTQVLLTIYWRDKDKRPRFGRETLRVDLSVPVLDLCPKRELRSVRGFWNLRMVAPDHFIADDIAGSQEFAREELCTAERSLRFMEHTGLRPMRRQRDYPNVLSRDRLPGIDHPTSWIDPRTGCFVLIDEPYGNAARPDERAVWASRNGWRIEKARWPGMYNPYACDLYVSVDGRSGINVEELMAAIDAIPRPVVSDAWSGESVASWDTFLSAAAVTSQDKRRAKCKGMVYPEPSRSTLPYNYAMGCSRRRPIGELGVPNHINVGRAIKVARASPHVPSGAWTRLGSLQAELENWMAIEIGPEGLPGPEFFEVYYGWVDRDQELLNEVASAEDIVSLLRGIRGQLVEAYTDCAPLRQQLQRIDLSVKWIENRAKRLGGGGHRRRASRETACEVAVSTVGSCTNTISGMNIPAVP